MGEGHLSFSLHLPMDSQAWLESSLQRSASLGLEVLQRASRRSVDWASTASQNPTMADEDTDIADEVLLPLAFNIYNNITL